MLSLNWIGKESIITHHTALLSGVRKVRYNPESDNP